jgi:hypothetical protein
MWQLIKDPCETKEQIPKTSFHILVEQGSLPKKKSTSQKKVNNKIHIACSNLYRKSFPNTYSSEFEPQHRLIPLESSDKVQLDPTIGCGLMLNNVRLDERNFTPKTKSSLAWVESQG